jgi:hypothetical protein
LGYGYSWWVDNRRKLAYAAGTGGQYLLVDRGRDLSIVLLKDTGRTRWGYLRHHWFGERTSPYALFAVHGVMVGGYERRRGRP